MKRAYDVIIVGSGPAGLGSAFRLTEPVASGAGICRAAEAVLSEGRGRRGL